MDVVVADKYPELLVGLNASELVVERVISSGAWLDAGYELFEQVFDPAVLDPKSVYLSRTSPASLAMRDFLPCYSIASVERDGKRLVVGFASADVMWLDQPGDAAILAVGNIGTSPAVKETGLRGVGTALLDAAIGYARSETAADGRRLLCVAAEAEPASLGFWKKRGFLRPEGCEYLQPPLEWDEAGVPVHPEVPETLLLAPIDMPADEVHTATVRSIIAAIYENWCLRVWRGELSDAALRRAEEYVMGRVLEQVERSMPAERMKLTAEF